MTVDLRVAVALRTEPYCWYMQWLRNANFWYWEMASGTKFNDPQRNLAHQNWNTVRDAVIKELPFVLNLITEQNLTATWDDIDGPTL